MGFEVDLPEGALLGISPWPSVSVVHVPVHESPSVRDLPEGAETWSDSRAAQWWAGRRALRAVCAAEGRPSVTIEVSPLGAPQVIDMRVSIAHTRDMAVAVASSAWTALGVDLERADRTINSLTRAFTADEQALIESRTVQAIQVLIAKEAASKAVGTGLEGSLTRWPVHIREGEVCVSSPDNAELRVRFYEVGDWLGAIAVGSAVGSALADG